MTMRLELAGVGYKQGTRLMITTAMDPVALVKMVAMPDVWNPLGSQPHGNRPQDKLHREGIAQYLETEETFVLGAVVLYVSPQDAEWVPDSRNGATGSGSVVGPGKLHLNYGAEFDVGDGQHRIGAYSDVLHRHESDDAVLRRLRQSGQPVVIVIDDNPLHRAQDFTDLQRNAKPPSGSIGMSMDRRQAMNRFTVELVQRPDLPIFAGGENVEFLKDSPGKFSAKLFSFKTVRYVTGTVLIGVAERSTRGWEKATDAAVKADPVGTMAAATDVWQALGSLPGLSEVISSAATAAELRAKSLLTSAGVLYAIAQAVHLAHEEDGMPYKSAVKALAKVSFDRPVRKPSEEHPLTEDESVLAGTLIDPKTGKVGSGRPAWEGAAEALRKRMVANKE